jgi:non-specific serine/threonine protein kinase/serine/threonine-protein kinase
MITPGTWARISDLFAQALEYPPAARAAFIESLRLKDEAAAAELASLLEAHDRPGEFLPMLPVLLEPRDLTGRLVGAYRLLRLLGAGGTGAVYLAERNDGAFAKHVAVKLLSSAFQQSRDRFLRERQILASLEHPNIARLLDAGATPDHELYLVMEYVEGLPIDRHCDSRRASVDERVALLQQVCAGVAHAHRNLIVHCDIKPENILVTPEGVVKLLDFGIARLVDRDRAVTLLRPATPAYSSPEQLRGDALTTASDVYSLGVLAYVLLSGRGPYGRQSNRVDQMVHAVLSMDPLRASAAPELAPERARQLKGDLDNVLAKAVARNPDRRYASVEQFANDLDAFRRGFPVRARPDTIAYRLRRTIGRHRAAFTLASVLGVGLVAATVFSVWQARLADRRFEDLRAFARSVVFEVNDQLATISGTTATRKLVVQTALQYLDRLNQDGVADTSLRAEIAAGYLRIARVQGGAFVPNLGDSAGAIASFRKAIATAGDDRDPALERLRIEALIGVAQLSVDPIRGAPEFDSAVMAAGELLAVHPGDMQSLRLLADAYHGHATVAHLTNNVPEHLAMAVRQIEVRERLRALGPGDWPDATSLARALAQRALAFQQSGNDEAALTDLERAQAVLDAAVARSGTNPLLERGLAEILSRRAPVLRALGRPSDAAGELLAAVDLLQPLVDSDPLNVQYRADLAYAWMRLGDIRQAEGRLDEALDLQRRALAIRRERSERHAGFVFVPWELARSLNSVADLLLLVSPPRADEAETLFAEARDVGLLTLARAPSYAQVRKQVALAAEGLARVALSRGGPRAAEALPRLRESATIWREIVSASPDDARSAHELKRVESLLRAGPGR